MVAWRLGFALYHPTSVYVYVSAGGVQLEQLPFYYATGSSSARVNFVKRCRGAILNARRLCALLPD